MKQTKIKKKICNFSKLKIGCLFKSLYLEKTHTTLHVYQICFLIVLLYIVEAKKGCKKKSLNICHWQQTSLKTIIYRQSSKHQLYV